MNMDAMLRRAARMQDLFEVDDELTALLKWDLEEESELYEDSLDFVAAARQENCSPEDKTDM